MNNQRLFHGLLAAVIAGGAAIGLLIDLPIPGATKAAKPAVQAGPASPTRGIRYDIGVTKVIPMGEKGGTMPSFSDIRANRERRAAADHTPLSVCHLPPAGATETVVLFGQNEPGLMSPVALDGMLRQTKATEIEIEPGAKPLYLILSSKKSAIWRFTGAVDRVSKVVLVSGATTNAGVPAAGSIGVEPAKVSVWSSRGCFAPFAQPDAAGEAKEAITRDLHRDPDVVGGVYGVAYLRLPSAVGGEPRSPPRAPKGFDARVWSMALRQSPGGLAQIAASEVHTPATAEPYDILPGGMGLAQLMHNGSVVFRDARYLIVQPIPHYPAAVAHWPTYVAPSVPKPDRDPDDEPWID